MKRSITKLKQNVIKKRMKKKLKNTNVLIIDEINMMKHYHFERLNRIIRMTKRRDEIFENVQLIVIENFCQLFFVKFFQFCLICDKNFQIVISKTHRCVDHENFFTQNL